MYPLHTTQAIVCSARYVGESDVRYRLFTRSHGLLIAHAQSVRELRGKHRYALQYGAEAEVTLVRGRFEWRVTSVRERAPLYRDVPTEYGVRDMWYARASLRRLLRLVVRVVPPETALPEAYDSFRADMARLTGLRGKENAQLGEALAVGRLLHALGHMAVPDGSPGEWLIRDMDGIEHIPAHDRRELFRTINGALSDTGL